MPNSTSVNFVYRKLLFLVMLSLLEEFRETQAK
jgi:hypothetical protein